MPVRIGTPDDQCQNLQGRIIDLVFLQDVVKRTAISIVCVLYIRQIKGNGAQLFGLLNNLIEWNKHDFRFPINKTFDQPGTCDAVNLRALACDPSHTRIRRIKGIYRILKDLSMTKVKTIQKTSIPYYTFFFNFPKLVE